MKRKLTRKELIEQIKVNMPSNLAEIEMVAFIEKYIADNVSFDETYYWSDTATKKKIYRLAKVAAKKPPEEVKRKLICTTMAELFVFALKEFGIDAEFERRIVKQNKKTKIETGRNEILDKLSVEILEHIDVIVHLNDGRSIGINIQGDITNLKTRSKPVGFGHLTDSRSRLSKVENEEIDRIFRKIYGLKDDEDFTYEYIKRLIYRPPFTDTCTERIEKIMNDARIQQELRHCGPVEAKEICKTIVSETLTRPVIGAFYPDATYVYKDFETEDYAYIDNCFLQGKNGKKLYTFLFYIDDTDSYNSYSKDIPANRICYIFAKRTGKMLKISPEELLKMYKLGMKIIPMRPDGTVLDKKNPEFQKFRNYEALAKNEGNFTLVDMNEFFDDEETER